MVVVNQPAWRARMPLNLATPLHDFPRNPEKVLPKFDPGKGVFAEDHLQNFYLDLNILNVDHEDVVCILFQYTFEPKASSWYFSLQANSIVDCDSFEKAFLGKFGNQKTVVTLMKELLFMRMENKEKVQDFNHRLTTPLNNFSAATKPTEESLIEYYTTTLDPPITMFVKRFGKITLV